MDEFLRTVTPDHKNVPKKFKEIEPFVEVILDIEPSCSYYVPLNQRDMWKGLMDLWKCNKLYMRLFWNSVNSKQRSPSTENCVGKYVSQQSLPWRKTMMPTH
jgi:hypothetical protein